MVFKDEVIGYLNLNKNIDMITGENYFYVNYVCVKKSFRRLGVAKKMFMEVFSICLKNNIKYLELTSNDSRVAAHKLYESLGFSVRETTRNNRTSHRNAILAVILPDKDGLYNYYDKNNLFPILKSNIENGYAYVVTWDDFLKYPQVDMNIAFAHKNDTLSYKIVKTV